LYYKGDLGGDGSLFGFKIIAKVYVIKVMAMLNVLTNRGIVLGTIEGYITLFASAIR